MGEGLGWGMGASGTRNMIKGATSISDLTTMTSTSAPHNQSPKHEFACSRRTVGAEWSTRGETCRP